MHPSDNDAPGAAPEREMPRYVSHKLVWALQISTINRMTPGKVVLSFKEKGYAALTFDDTDLLFARYAPIQGDFYVVYADGYKSLSPQKAFIDGYTFAGTPVAKGKPTIAELEAILREDDQPVHVNPDGSVSRIR